MHPSIGYRPRRRKLHILGMALLALGFLLNCGFFIYLILGGNRDLPLPLFLIFVVPTVGCGAMLLGFILMIIELVKSYQADQRFPTAHPIGRADKASTHQDQERAVPAEEELRDLRRLYDEELITEEEYAAKKKQILGLS